MFMLLLAAVSALTSSPTRLVSTLTSCWQTTSWLDVTYQSGTACVVLEPTNIAECQVFPSGVLAVLNVSGRPPLLTVISDFDYATTRRVCVSCAFQYGGDANELDECKKTLRDFDAASFSIESISHVANIQLVQTRTTMASYLECFTEPASLLVEGAAGRICASVCDTHTCSDSNLVDKKVVITVFGEGGASTQYPITAEAVQADDQSSAPTGSSIDNYCYVCPQGDSVCLQGISELLSYPWTYGLLRETAEVDGWGVQIDQNLYSVQGKSYQTCYSQVRLYVLHDSMVLQLVSASSQAEVCRISNSMAVDSFRYGLGVRSKDRRANYFQYLADGRFDMGRSYTIQYSCENLLTPADGAVYSDVTLTDDICAVLRDPEGSGFSSADELLTWASVDFLDATGGSLQVVRLQVTDMRFDCFQRLTALIYDDRACLEMSWVDDELASHCYLDFSSRRTLSLHLMRPNPDKPFNPDSLGRLQVRSTLDTGVSQICFPCSSFSSSEYKSCSAMLKAMWNARASTYVAFQDSATAAGEYDPAIPVDVLKNRQYRDVYITIGVLLAVTAIGLSVDVGIRWSSLSKERKVLARITRRQRRENNRLQRRLDEQVSDGAGEPEPVSSTDQPGSADSAAPAESGDPQDSPDPSEVRR